MWRYPIMITERSNKYHYKVDESGDYKRLSSPNANYIFNKKDGMTLSWGKTLKEDPECFPGPVIADIEVTVGCLGLKGDGKSICPFCYKSNTANNVKYMTFETFKKLFDVLPKTLTQIAFGADATLQLNPDLWKIMEYSRENGVIPNITLANVINDETADNLAKYCGAVAISRYNIPDICYDSVKKLTDRGMKQVNIHYMISKETLKGAYETIDSAVNDERLKGLNAIVFLSLKTKGRGEKGYTPLTQKEFTDLVMYAKTKKVGVGFDSCSSLKAFNAYKGTDAETEVSRLIEPCESSLLSLYINVEGKYFPCSFTEGYKNESIDWSEGLDVLACKDAEDFLDKIWNNEKTNNFRKRLLESRKENEFSCRTCPLYNI